MALIAKADLPSHVPKWFGAPASRARCAEPKIPATIGRALAHRGFPIGLIVYYSLQPHSAQIQSLE
jgi:hypothetical protein